MMPGALCLSPFHCLNDEWCLCLLACALSVFHYLNDEWAVRVFSGSDEHAASPLGPRLRMVACTGVLGSRGNDIIPHYSTSPAAFLRRFMTDNPAIQPPATDSLGNLHEPMYMNLA